MTYANARKLHNGDEVTVKKTGRTLTVVSTRTPRPMNLIQRNDILIECNDGAVYHHTAIR